MSFWNKPIGEILEDRKDKKAADAPVKRYKPMIFGTMKTGNVELKRDGRMFFRNADKAAPFHASDVTSIEIENATELERRATLSRAGGGALVGGVLLGPVGLLAGLGMGALAKKERGGEKFLVITLTDGRTVIAQVARKHVTQAHALRNQFRTNAA